jgi:hypothetical protein
VHGRNRVMFTVDPVVLQTVEHELPDDLVFNL